MNIFDILHLPFYNFQSAKPPCMTRNDRKASKTMQGDPALWILAPKKCKLFLDGYEVCLKL